MLDLLPAMKLVHIYNREIWTCLIVSLLIAAILLSNNLLAQEKKRVYINTFSFSPTYQIEVFNWSIAGDLNGRDPNVLSELIWNNRYLGYKAETIFSYGNIETSISFDKVKAIEGKVKDNDYAGNNREFTTSSESFNSRGGSKRSVYILVGNKRLRNLQIGYHQENGDYRLNHDLKGIFSSYNVKIKGVSIGYLYGNFFQNRKLSLTTRSIFSTNNYKGQGSWILRNDLKKDVSFFQKASGVEFFSNVNLSYNIYIFSLGLGTSFKLSHYFKGIDKLYYVNGNSALTRLNNVDYRFSEIIIYFGIRI